MLFPPRQDQSSFDKVDRSHCKSPETLPDEIQQKDLTGPCLWPRRPFLFAKRFALKRQKSVTQVETEQVRPVRSRRSYDENCPNREGRNQRHFHNWRGFESPTQKQKLPTFPTTHRRWIHYAQNCRSLSRERPHAVSRALVQILPKEWNRRTGRKPSESLHPPVLEMTKPSAPLMKASHEVFN